MRDLFYQEKDWLSVLPEGWRISRLKDHTSTNTGITFTKADIVEEGSAVLSYGQVHAKNNPRTEINHALIRYIPESITVGKESSLVNEGDFIFADTSEDLEGCGNCIYINEPIELYAGYHTTIVHNLSLECGKYFAYLFMSDQWRSQIRKKVKSVKLFSISQGILNQTFIVVPPSDKQEAIAAYLDKECAKIGREVGLLERKADCYSRLRRSLINQAVTRGLKPNVPMRPTKYGLMPEHWKESRLKDLYFMYGGITGKKGNDFLCEEDTPNAKPFIKYTNILNNFPIQNCNHGLCIIYDSENQNCVEKNDLLFLMSSEDYESIGLASVVDKTMGEIYLNSFCKGLHLTTKEVLSKFIALQLRAEIIHDALRYEARGFTRINLKVDKVMCHQIFFPHIDEQREIVEYIAKKCSQIDSIIAKIKVKIERLKQLKRSLINEVVTGQRAINK